MTRWDAAFVLVGLVCGTLLVALDKETVGASMITGVIGFAGQWARARITRQPGASIPPPER